MKKSSEVILISSSTSKRKNKAILDEMIDIVESDLWISVEDGYSGNSYWIATPEDEIDDWSPVGIIEINTKEDTFNKILSLVHEVGHYFLDQDEHFKGTNHQMFVESLAWYLGYKYFHRMGYSVDIEEYKKETHKCLSEYVRSLNEKDNN